MMLNFNDIKSVDDFICKIKCRDNNIDIKKKRL